MRSLALNRFIRPSATTSYRRPPRHSNRTERRFVRLFLALLGGVIVTVALGIIGYRFALQWEDRHLLRRAHAFFDAGDSKSASLTAQRVLQLSPSNVEACRFLAQIAERDGLSSAIKWRQQVVSLLPESMDDAIALAKTELQFNEILLAEKTLINLTGKAEQIAAFHEVEAQLALIKRDSATAEHHLREAVRLDPSNKVD